MILLLKYCTNKRVFVKFKSLSSPIYFFKTNNEYCTLNTMKYSVINKYRYL